MYFDLVDRVLEQTPTRIMTLKVVSVAEEYLQDHFPGFPVLPGVFMIEAMVQAARRLVEPTSTSPRLTLAGVRAIKYGRFVRPGEALVVDVCLHKQEGDTYDFKGQASVRGPDGQAIPNATAVAGRFTLRPVQTL
ncbi:MAG: 3-hydroxyacyl-ACP dehydratase FabZ family protein [bacterium]